MAISKWFDYSNYHLDRNDETSANIQLNTHRYTRNDIRTAENQLDPDNPFTNSKVMLATNIFIYANNSIVGMVQSLSVNETRQINKLQAIGWEGVVQAVPSNTRGGTLQLARVALYDSTLYNALGLNVSGLPHNQLGSLVHDVTGEDYDGDGAVGTNKGWDQYSTPANNADGPKVSQGYTFRTLKDQRVPIEIQIKTRRRGDDIGDTDNFYVTTYIDCWLSNYSKPYGVGQIYVSETATVAYGDVY